MANLPYVQGISVNTQLITVADTPQNLVVDTLDDINEFSIDTTTGTITYNKEGLARKFAYIVAPQVAREGECQEEVPNFRVWIQKKANGEESFIDVPYANVLINVNRHRETKDVLVLSGLITLEKDDQLRIMMSSDVANEVKIEYIPKTGEPNIPSVIASIFNIGLEKDEPVEP